jgi:hypothetical protein
MNPTPLNAVNFQNAMALVESSLSLKMQLPDQIFAPRYTHFRFAQFDWMLFPECWVDLQVILQKNDCSELLVGPLEPHPECYFHHEFSSYHWWSIFTASSATEYSSILTTAPASSEVDSLLFNSERLCWIAEDCSFVIVGDRSHECAIFASINELVIDGLSDKWMSCANFIHDDLLIPGHAPGFVDAVLVNYG